MSETVHYRGKLNVVEMFEGENIESQCERMCNENGFNNLDSYIDTWQEQLCDTYYEEYYIYNSVLYRVDKKEIDFDEDIFTATVNENNKIEFEVKYYNGGCGFTEALDEAMNSLAERGK